MAVGAKTVASSVSRVDFQNSLLLRDTFFACTACARHFLTSSPSVVMEFLIYHAESIQFFFQGAYVRQRDDPTLTLRV